MALPQRRQDQNTSPNTYQYQVSNVQRIEKRRPQLNDDFQYLNKAEFSDASNDDRILSSENPTLRAQAERTKQEAANESAYLPAEEPAPITRPNVGYGKKKSMLRSGKRLVKKARVTVVSGSIVAWGMAAWFPQFIFALVSTIFLGMMGAGDAVVNSNFITAAAGWITNSATRLATGLLTGTSFTVGDIGAGLFIALYLVAFAIGLGTLMVANIQYMATLIQPMSGDNASIKYLAFLIAVCGYATPLLNLFPWFLVFVAVVWKYPK